MAGVVNPFSTQLASGVEGSLFRVDPSPRLRLGTFNGRRPSRESLDGNGAGAPPVSRFLYRPHYRRIKSESQDFLLLSAAAIFRILRWMLRESEYSITRNMISSAI